MTNFSLIGTNSNWVTSEKTLIANGIYQDTFANVNGCDSIIILNLTVLDTTHTNLTASICSGETYTLNGNEITTGGIHRDTLPSVNGCDSILILDLTMLDTAHTNLTAIICKGETYTFNDKSITTSGTHRDTLSNVNGCDSIIILELDFCFEGEIAGRQQLCPMEALSLIHI